MTITFPRGRKKSGEEKYRRNIFIVYNICSCVASAKIMKNAEGLNESTIPCIRLWNARQL